MNISDNNIKHLPDELINLEELIINNNVNISNLPISKYNKIKYIENENKEFKVCNFGTNSLYNLKLLFAFYDY